MQRGFGTTSNRGIQCMIFDIQDALSASVVIAARTEDKTQLDLNMIRAVSDMTSLVQGAIVCAITNNASFPNPSPSLIDVSAALDELVVPP